MIRIDKIEVGERWLRIKGAVLNEEPERKFMVDIHKDCDSVAEFENGRLIVDIRQESEHQMWADVKIPISREFTGGLILSHTVHLFTIQREYNDVIVVSSAGTLPDGEFMAAGVTVIRGLTEKKPAQ